MVFVEGDDYRALRRPGDDPAQFRAPVRLPRRQAVGLDAAVTSGLVAWYRFEDSANTVIDATNALGVGANQTAFDGTVNGASFVPNGGVRDVVSEQNSSGAYDLDGVDDNINVPLNTDIASTGELTVSCFIKNDTTDSEQDFVSRLQGDISTQFKLGISGDGDLQPFVVQTGGNVDIEEPTSLIPAGQFNHVAFTYKEGDALELFVDASSISSVSSSSTLVSDTSSDLRIGQRPNGSFSNDAIIDDVRLYNRALSASEINQIYTNTDPDQ
jgi:hypothetical protein